MLNYAPFLFIFILLSCGSARINREEPGRARQPAQDLLVQKVAFGSCNDEDLDPVLWDDVLTTSPDLWVWLGDNIYADTEDMDLMWKKYEKQLRQPEYKALMAKVPVIGIWDDHDYGINNGGREYPKKAESRDLLFRFLNVSPGHPAWNREGAYQSYTVGPHGKRVKFILLDVRYFRDPTPAASWPEYKIREADILGEAQWNWLEKELEPTSAELFVIGSGIQVIPEEHIYEKWANFPSSRERLLNLVEESGLEEVVLISGDRHLAEISSIELPGLETAVQEVTSSSMSRPSTLDGREPNRYRISPVIHTYNFGLLEIDWKENGPVVHGSVIGDDGVQYVRVLLE